MEVEGRQLSISVQNPLLFDHIVERVISFMDVEFLPSIRLVNRQWEKFASPKLVENLHKFPVILPGQEDTSGDSKSKMERYLTYRAKEPRLIFHNFTLENLLFSSPLVDKFILTCAAEITELKLQFNEYQQPTAFFKFFKWMGALVNLKVLTLDVDSSSSPKLGISTYVGCKRTLNLKRLCFNYNGYNQAAYGQLCGALTSCESLGELSMNGMHFRNIRDYYFNRIPRDCPNALVEISVEEMDSDNLEFLMGQQDLKLKALKCKSLVLFQGGNRFSEFLEKHKNSLESVVVDEVLHRGQYELDVRFEFTFPDVMPKLKVFRMGLSTVSATSSHADLRTGRIHFSPVNFPEQLPSLEKLILYDGSTENYRSNDPDEWGYLRGFFEGSDPHRKLTDLCLPFASSKLRKSVGAVFPVITSLKMELGLDQNLLKICEMWPQLKSLDLTVNGDRKKMKETGMEGVDKNKRAHEGSSKDIDSDSGLISLANLKALKYFKLRMIGDCKGSLINFNVTRALCKMPCLEFLLFNQHDITKRGTREFLKYHPLLKKVDCPFHPEVYKIQKEYLPNDFIPSEFSTDSDSHCDCSFTE